MFKISDEKELLNCFRPFEREHVELPRDLRFPLLVRDYLTWLEPSGARAYLVFDDGMSVSPLGVVFQRDGAATTAAMCEWCHSVRSGEKVGLLSATASSNRRVGIYLCRDLSCKDKLQGIPGVDDVPTTLGRRERLARIVGKMSEFARRELF